MVVAEGLLETVVRMLGVASWPLLAFAILALGGGSRRSRWTDSTGSLPLLPEPIGLSLKESEACAVALDIPFEVLCEAHLARGRAAREVFAL